MAVNLEDKSGVALLIRLPLSRMVPEKMPALRTER